MNVPMYWHKCICNHEQLVPEDQAKLNVSIKCDHCKAWFKFNGTLDKPHLVGEAFPNLRG